MSVNLLSNKTVKRVGALATTAIASTMFFMSPAHAIGVAQCDNLDYNSACKIASEDADQKAKGIKDAGGVATKAISKENFDSQSPYSHLSSRLYTAWVIKQSGTKSEYANSKIGGINFTYTGSNYPQGDYRAIPTDKFVDMDGDGVFNLANGDLYYVRGQLGSYQTTRVKLDCAALLEETPPPAPVVVEQAVPPAPYIIPTPEPTPVPVVVPKQPSNDRGYIGAEVGYGNPNIKGGGLTVSAGAEAEIGVTDWLSLYGSGIAINNQVHGFEGQALVGPQFNLGDVYARVGAGRAIAGSGTQNVNDVNGDEVAMAHAADINGYIADWAAFGTVGARPSDNLDVNVSYRKSIGGGDNQFTDITGGASFENTDDGENGTYGYISGGLTKIDRLQGIASAEREVISVRGALGDKNLLTDSLGLEIGGQYTQSTTSIQPTPTFALGSKTATYGPSVSVLWTPTDNLDVRLTGSYMFQTENNDVNGVSNFSNKEQGPGVKLSGVYRFGQTARNTPNVNTVVTYKDCIMARSANSFDQNPNNDDPTQCDHLASAGSKVYTAADGTRSIGRGSISTLDSTSENPAREGKRQSVLGPLTAGGHNFEGVVPSEPMAESSKLKQMFEKAVSALAAFREASPQEAAQCEQARQSGTMNEEFKAACAESILLAEKYAKKFGRTPSTESQSWAVRMAAITPNAQRFALTN